MYGSSTFCTWVGCVAEFRAADGLLELLSSTLGLKRRNHETPSAEIWLMDKTLHDLLRGPARLRPKLAHDRSSLARRGADLEPNGCIQG